LEEVCAES